MTFERFEDAIAALERIAAALEKLVELLERRP